ncbi:MAG: protein kinase [Pirellulales bacterium]
MTEPDRPAHDDTTQLYQQGSPAHPGNEPSSAVSQSTWESEANAAEVVRVLDQVMSDRQAGREISREALLAAHPQIADQLAACLAGLEFLHPPASVSEASKTRTIGDFRLGREVGRGGMGAVYEAEQISLARRVALKVLRFGPVSDHEAIDRFRREAETVATLHHTNIVPIFYVGNEQGVNYYAMQFIDGRDLAQVIADSTTEITSKQVAEWGLQAAEALAHAHKRGVIHRDVKPSNLILDRDGRVWLTDFGLARRLDDVTLSLAGMLLGTPRYMSPEHARASTRRIDHRSDLFSLGATLYELLARRPAFAGDTAHDVIQHILSEDPVPLRQFNPHIDRDLETVVMKCLAKEPDERYASAEELAADLRAVLEERPIRARRAGLVEQSWRWVKKNRRSVSQVATAVAATLLVSIAAVLSRSAYLAWHEASVLVETDDLGAVAEFIDSGDRSVARETLPMQTASKLSTGDYKLRVTAERTLSQSFDIMVDTDSSGARRKANVSDRWLQPPVLIGDFYDHCDLGLQKVVVGWNRDGLSLRNLNGNLDKRSIPIEPGKTPGFEAFHGFQLPTRQSSVTATGYGEDASARPWLLNGPMDVNGDGIGDLIVAGRHQAWVLAVSGDGSGVLWIAGLADELKNAKTNPVPDSNLVSAVLYPPQRINDADGDGRDDLIVVWMEISERTAQSAVGTVSSNRRIGVISSSTGKPIREITLPDSAFALPQNVSAPRDLSIPVGWMGGRSMHGGHNMHVGNFRIRSPAVFEQTGPHTYVPTDVHFVHDATRSKVPVVIVGDRLVQLDFTESNEIGKAWTQEWTLDFRPGKDVEWYDVDGDGIDELIALAERPSGVNPTDPPEPALHVWSLLNGKSLWSKPLDTYWPHKSLTRYDYRTQPRVIDLDGDGKLEIVFGDGRSHGPKWFSGGSGAALLPRGTISAVRAVDGEPLWSTSVATIDADIDRFVIGEDMYDSVRDVFTVTASIRKGWISALMRYPERMVRYCEPLRSESSTTLLSGIFARRKSDGGMPVRMDGRN